MVNVFSFCIYGQPLPKYHIGLLENIEMIQKYYPDWKVFVYSGEDTDPSYIAYLRNYAHVTVFETHKLGAANMIDRFYAIDEPGVDLMFVRDADSRIHWKDRWAMNEFLKSDKQLHIIRDHPEHTAAILGGLWGLRKSAGISVRSLYASYTEDTSLGWRWAHDQNFLIDEIYPKLKHRALIHYSNKRAMLGEKDAVEFPFQWSGDNHCGRVETAMSFRDFPGLESTTPRQVTVPKVDLGLPKVPLKIFSA